jgi:hypothetical protein
MVAIGAHLFIDAAKPLVIRNVVADQVARTHTVSISVAS